jgi:hypothetical protein
LVAFPAKRDQVGLSIVTKGAALYDVVNIEILGASTFLTAPTITYPRTGRNLVLVSFEMKAVQPRRVRQCTAYTNHRKPEASPDFNVTYRAAESHHSDATSPLHAFDERLF